MTKGFWATVAAGLKPKMVVRFSAFLSCLCFAYLPGLTLKLIALVIAMISGCIMFSYDIGSFIKPFQSWRKIQRGIIWETPPVFFTDLAQKMNVKLNKKRPYGVTDAHIGAAAVIFDSRVIVSKDVLSFPEAERNAVIAHELGHLRQSIKLFLLMYVAMFGAAFLSDVHPLITVIGSTALFLIFRTFISWDMEYDADNAASKYTSKDAIASALKRLVKPEEQDQPSDTHPSVNDRLTRIFEPKQRFWIRISFLLVGIFVTESFRKEFLHSYFQDLDEYCQQYPNYVRPIVGIIELIKAMVIWGLNCML